MLLWCRGILGPHIELVLAQADRAAAISGDSRLGDEVDVGANIWACRRKVSGSRTGTGLGRCGPHLQRLATGDPSNRILFRSTVQQKHLDVSLCILA